ncbi:MAG: formylmethanofuran dehydrogenase subunit B [Planctomycetales bacterium]|nr:formylmethanofuran dehydrogenase subunit B [Planctomycetales bacterium]
MASSEQTIQDVACTVCGCVCDDLTVTVRDDRVERITPDCPLAAAWFQALRDAEPVEASVDGKPTSLAVAERRAAEILGRAKAPLVFGLSRSSTDGQRAAVALADQLGACVDTTASVCHGPSIMAIQQVGESTSSLGEVRHRSDLVLFWGADPVTSHPRHLERYSVDASGQFVPRGRADRTLIVIDTQPTATSARADHFLRISPGKDFEAIWALRMLIQGHVPAASADLGAPLAELQDLASRLKACRYGVVFFGLGLAQQGAGHANVEALLRLVAELNDYTRFTARRLRIPGDVTGADCVLCWWTGFPFAVSLSRGFPRYNPGEYSANELLSRQEVDACLLVGSESVGRLSPAAQRHLARIPTIVLDSPHVAPDFPVDVRITTAVYGVHLAGTAYRMDEIPIPLRRLCSSPLSSDHAVLGRILDHLRGVVT